ncbi:MAG TPA: helix-turn-helix domain-containing protein [Candidatus Nanoarchaeia archaeon]|nr:helix-turn-helix domain-containing protein [Candidatus Nanoarchaeia archaeon]
MKKLLIEELSMSLLRKRFAVKNFSRGCFDIFARREDVILLIKVLEDANAISERYSRELEKVASYMGATPIVVARKAGSLLEDNIVYTRYGIYTLNSDTFTAALENQLPFVKKSNAGITATIVGQKIRERREEMGLSQNELSRRIGISGRMVGNYEKGLQEVTISKAFKIYDVFGGSVFKRIDVFHPRQISIKSGTSMYSKKFNELGFQATDTKDVPFDIIAKMDKEIILTELGDKMKPGFESLSRLMEADKLVIFKKKRPKDIPSMKKEEFMEIRQAKELIKRIKES